MDDPVFEANASETEAASSRDEGSLIMPPPASNTTRLLSQRTLQWTSTKTPATSVGDALSNLDGMDRIERGIRVLKVTSRGKLCKRILTISEDRFALFVTHAPIKKSGGFRMAKSLDLPLFSRKGIRGMTVSNDDLRSSYVRYIDVADLDGLQLGVVGTVKLENARQKVNRLKGEESEIDAQVGQIVTILHHGNQTLDVLIPDKTDRQDLIRCLRMMRSTYLAAQKHVSNEDLLLRYIWYDVDANRNGLIDKREFGKILSRINFHIKNADRKFVDYSKELGAQASPEGLTYPQVMTLLQRLKKLGKARTVAQQIWNEIFGSGLDKITVTDFLKKFLHNVQGMRYLTLQDAQEILMALNHMEINHAGAHRIDNVIPDKELTCARFEAFLFDPMNDAYDPWALRPGGNLDHPIAQYWINTSHNTYLTGDQLQSTSSVSMYMLALRRGCRCLELDCWDGEKSKTGECLPVVFHGHTLTSKILFSDILRGVKSFMVANPDSYPIILSLENHCSHPFQEAMATSLQQILNEFLYIPTDAEHKGDLPSPEYLKGKVVIKGKRPPEPDEGADSVKKYEVAEEEEGDPYEGGSNEKLSSGKKPKIVPELANLTLFHGVKFKAFEASIDSSNTHMHSIGETKISKILGKQAGNTILWRQYNTHHMTRTYPAGSRLDSSNYNPMTAWSVGCQMVALNFQSCDTPLILNDGRFRADRRSGYMLKPKSLLDDALERAEEDDGILPLSTRALTTLPPDLQPDAFDFIMGDLEQILCGERTPSLANHELLAKQPQAQRALVMNRIRTYQQNTTNHVNQMRLRVRIVAGSCLPKPKGAKQGETIDPYVSVTLHDVKERGDGKVTYLTANFTTNTVQDDGFCPAWNDKSLKEFTVVHPEVAMLQFSLKESDVGMDDRVADAAIPCHRLRTGYRSIQLYDQNNTRTGAFGFARLLVQIQIV